MGFKTEITITPTAAAIAMEVLREELSAIEEMDDEAKEAAQPRVEALNDVITALGEADRIVIDADAGDDVDG